MNMIDCSILSNVLVETFMANLCTLCRPKQSHIRSTSSQHRTDEEEAFETNTECRCTVAATEGLWHMPRVLQVGMT